jgi:hypothetical protein
MIRLHCNFHSCVSSLGSSILIISHAPVQWLTVTNWRFCRKLTGKLHFEPADERILGRTLDLRCLVQWWASLTLVCVLWCHHNYDFKRLITCDPVHFYGCVLDFYIVFIGIFTSSHSYFFDGSRLVTGILNSSCNLSIIMIEPMPILAAFLLPDSQLKRTPVVACTSEKCMAILLAHESLGMCP